MTSQELMKQLTEANGLSGFEKEVIQRAEDYLADTVLLTTKGGLNNLYISRPTDLNKSKPVVLLDAHSDELGFMVQAITAKGLIKVVPIGSWDPRNVSAQKVRILTDQGWKKGVFASKPPHFMTEEEKKQSLSFDKLMVDVGASSYDEAITVFGIRLGAPLVPDVDFEYLSEDVVMAKALDNRLGCCLVLELMKHFQDEELPITLVGALSSQEEVGARGAKITANDIKPSVGIIFEGTPADDSFVDALEVQGGMGKGPQIRHRDAQMISNPEFTRFAIDLAKENQIPHQEAVRQSGSTNAAIYHTTNVGTPSIVIGVPVRYAHTHYGLSSLKDYHHALEWGKTVIKALNPETIQSF
jgi:putative aminopeptidase FrvX